MYAFSSLGLQLSLVLICFWKIYFVYIDQISKHTSVKILLHEEKAYKLYIIKIIYILKKRLAIFENLLTANRNRLSG
jgi:hypothetical protein